jgi:alpha-L-fucosidase
MRRKLVMVLAVVMLIQLVVFIPVPLKAATTYTATWASVDTHPPAAEWFQDAKFGLWYHWGAFSVPAYGSEWYPRNMYISGSGEYNHHVATFGTPTAWPYHNFINGANDKTGHFTKFAPVLKSQGGNFDPDEWAQLFYNAGAKMAGPVAEHHDGFSMWDSTVNEWNSVDKGPGLDLAGLFATAFRAKGMKYLVSSHNAYNFSGYYDHVPTQSDPSLKKLYGQLTATEQSQLWYDKLKELIDQYQPDYIWHDFNLPQVSEQKRLEFLAYYYNKGIDWGKEVVVSYNDGFNKNGEVQQVERGGYANITYPFWLCEDSVSSSSWCYTQGIGYYSGKAILHSLIDRVSKNGCLLLNLAPMADGSIPQGQKDILTVMGNWLWPNGEAIYATRAWEKFGEGPTQMGSGGFSTPVEGTATDIRFTRNKANNVLYAIGMGWPAGNQMVITTLKTSAFNTSTITGITFIGGSSCSWTQDSTGLKVNLPSNLSNTVGYAVKISFSGTIPSLVVPPVDAYSQIEAENYNQLSGSVQAETCGEGGQNLGYIATNDYAVYKNVAFGTTGPNGFTGRIAGLDTSGRIAVRLDSPTGTLLGTLNGVNTGAWQTYTTASCSVSGTTGNHDLYLVFTAGLNLNWFKFTTGATPTPTPAATPTPTPAYTTLNDNASGITYSGSWSVSSNRNLGDYNNDVHYSTTNTNYCQYTFTGTRVDYITEKYTDEGNVDVYIDGVLQTTVSCYNATRLAQQTVYSKTGLTAGSHTIKLIKTSGTYMLVDAFKIYP